MLNQLNSIKSVLCILCITILEIIALCKGMDGLALSLSIAALSGLGGYALAKQGGSAFTFIKQLLSKK